MPIRDLLLQLCDDGIRVLTPDGSTVFEPTNSLILAMQRFSELRDANTEDLSLDPRDTAHLCRYAATVGDELGRLLFVATAPERGTLVRILCEDRLVLGWPWELARVGGRYVFCDDTLGLVRACEQRTGAMRPKDDHPFSLAVAVAAPWPVDDLSHEMETLRVLNALPFEGAALTAAQGGTLEEIIDVAGRQTALHLVLHGAPGSLSLEATTGGPSQVSIEDLTRAFVARGCELSMVFVSGCDAMLPPPNEPERDGVLPLLHVLGVPDVIGYQGAVADDVATLAAETFYGALAKGASPSGAVAAVRAFLATDERVSTTRPFAWTQPNHLQGGDDVPVRLASRNPRRHAPEMDLIGRRATIRDMSRKLREGPGFIYLYGPIGVGRSSLARAALAELPGEHLVLRLPREDSDEAASTLVEQITAWADLPRSPGTPRERLERALAVVRARGPSLPGFVVVDGVEDVVDAGVLQQIVCALHEGKARAIVATDYFGRYSELGPHAVIRPLGDDAAYRLVTCCPNLGRLSRASRREIAAEWMGMPGPTLALDSRLAGVNAETNDDVEWERLVEPAIADVRTERRATLFVPRWARLTPEQRLCAVRLSVFPRRTRIQEARELSTPSDADEASKTDLLNALLHAGIIWMQEGQVWVDYEFMPWIRESSEATDEVVQATARACAGLMTRVANEQRDPFLLADAAELWLEAGDVRGGANLAITASNWCWNGGRADYALDVLERVLPSPIFEQLPRKERQLHLAARGRALRGAGRFKEAEEALTTSLGIACDARDAEGEAVALACLGNVFLDIGDLSRTKTFFRAALEADKRIENETMDTRASRARTLGSLGHIAAMEGHYGEALRLHEEYRTISIREGLDWDAARALGSIASTLLKKGDVAGALRTYEARLEVARKMGDQRGVGVVLCSQGIALFDSDNVNEALEKFTECLVSARNVGDQMGEARARYHCARVHLALGDAARAVTEATKVTELVPATGLAGAAGRLRKRAMVRYVISHDADALEHGL